MKLSLITEILPIDMQHSQEDMPKEHELKYLSNGKKEFAINVRDFYILE